MKQTFDLNKMGLSPMNDEEMQEIDGGFFPIIIYGVMLLTAVAQGQK